MEKSFSQNIFELLSKPKKVGDLLLESLPLPVRDALVGSDLPAELGGSGSVLTSAPTLSEVVAAKNPSAERKQQYEDENLATGLMGAASPYAVGATRFAKKYGSVADKMMRNAVDWDNMTYLLHDNAYQINKARKEIKNAKKRMERASPDGVTDGYKKHYNDVREEGRWIVDLLKNKKFRQGTDGTPQREFFRALGVEITPPVNNSLKQDILRGSRPLAEKISKTPEAWVKDKKDSLTYSELEGIAALKEDFGRTVNYADKNERGKSWDKGPLDNTPSMQSLKKQYEELVAKVEKDYLKYKDNLAEVTEKYPYSGDRKRAAQKLYDKISDIRYNLSRIKGAPEYDSSKVRLIPLSETIKKLQERAQLMREQLKRETESIERVKKMARGEPLPEDKILSYAEQREIDAVKKKKELARGFKNLFESAKKGRGK